MATEAVSAQRMLFSCANKSSMHSTTHSPAAACCPPPYIPRKQTPLLDNACRSTPPLPCAMALNKKNCVRQPTTETRKKGKTQEMKKKKREKTKRHTRAKGLRGRPTDRPTNRPSDQPTDRPRALTAWRAATASSSFFTRRLSSPTSSLLADGDRRVGFAAL